MAMGHMSADEWTFPPLDWVPVNNGEDTDLQATLGYTPRAIRADGAGVLVFRCADSDADRTFNVQAGEQVIGFFTHIKSATDCSPSVAK